MEQLLRDPAMIPEKECLKNAMGNELFGVYDILMHTLVTDLNAEYQWRYYNDGKAWLCRVTFKKKTLCWISAWKGYIKAGYFFTEKYSAGILQLPVKPEILENFKKSKPIGKLRSLVVFIQNLSDLDDFVTVAQHKKTLK